MSVERSPFEELVRRALLDVNYQEFEQIAARADVITYTPSPRHLAWEKKFLAAPFAFAKKHARPAWQRFLRTAAGIVLAVSVAFGGLMAASPTARAWVQQIFAQWFGEYARFSFSGNAGQETGEWKTTWLPAGFELVEETNMSMLSEVSYSNVANDILQFTYAPAGSTIITTDSESQEYVETAINGTLAHITQAVDAGGINYLIWTDPDSGTAFELSAAIDTDDLIRIANGIQKIK